MQRLIPDPILTPFTAFMLIRAAAMSVSNLEYIGAPNPTGIPDALSSIIAPHDDPDFLTAKRYFSHSLIFYQDRKMDFLISESFSNFVCHKTSILTV